MTAARRFVPSAPGRTFAHQATSQACGRPPLVAQLAHADHLERLVAQPGEPGVRAEQLVLVDPHVVAARVRSPRSPRARDGTGGTRSTRAPRSAGVQLRPRSRARHRGAARSRSRAPVRTPACPAVTRLGDEHRELLVGGAGEVVVRVVAGERRRDQRRDAVLDAERDVPVAPLGRERGAHVRVEVGDVDAPRERAVDLRTPLGLDRVGVRVRAHLGHRAPEVAVVVGEPGRRGGWLTGRHRYHCCSAFRVRCTPRSSDGSAAAAAAPRTPTGTAPSPSRR